MVTLVGQEIPRGRHISVGRVTPHDWHFIVCLLAHDIGYVRGICRGDGDGSYVINLAGDKVSRAYPEDLIAFFTSLGFAVKRIGLEAGPLSQWLQSGLKCAGLEVVLLETRHVKAALSA
jgi:hypothetical protein